jgi:hypothetical protein
MIALHRSVLVSRGAALRPFFLFVTLYSVQERYGNILSMAFFYFDKSFFNFWKFSTFVAESGL